MAIKLPTGFEITSTQPIDSRITLTKAEMLAIIDAKMPDKYFAICKDDGKLYVYDKSITEPSAETGKFKLYEAPVDEADMATKLPNAMQEVMQTESGAEEILNAMFDTEHFKTTIDNKIDIAISLIQAVESN